MFELIIQSLIYGIIISAVYGILAMGFSLVAGIMRILNLAHADFLTLGAYIAYWLWVFLSLNPVLSLPLSLVFGFVFGIVSFRLLINKVAISPDSALIATFALSGAMQESMKLAWTPNYRGLPWTMGSISYSFLTLPTTYIVTFIANIAIILVVYMITFKTFFGKAFRALTMDRSAAALCGVNVNATLAYGFAFASALAFTGGNLYVVYASSGIHPYMGSGLMIKAIVIATVGGMGNPWGALIGGIFIGLLEQLLPVTVLKLFPTVEPFSFTPFIYLLIFLIVLIIRPRGLLGGRV